MSKIEKAIAALRSASDAYEALPDVYKERRAFALCDVNAQMLRLEADRLEKRRDQIKEGLED